LEAYLGHSDVQRLTGENLIDWKRSMVEAGLRPKTIQDAKLAPLRAILQWGVQNKLIPSNPADGISLDVRGKFGKRGGNGTKVTGLKGGGRPKSS
jgi:site-specific recombinase XerC